MVFKVVSALTLLFLSMIAIHLFSATLPIIETEETIYYEVDATARDEIFAQFSQRGPHGNAASTEWTVSSRWPCRVRLHTVFTYPRHTNLDSLSDTKRNRWYEYMKNTQLHERIHQSHGRSAAGEVVSQFCFFPQTVWRYWALKDKVFDLESQHGRRDGAILNW